MVGVIWWAGELQGLCHTTRSPLRCFQTNVEEMHDKVEWQWRVVLDNEGIGTLSCRRA
jgi:hypothetical protein